MTAGCEHAQGRPVRRIGRPAGLLAAVAISSAVLVTAGAAAAFGAGPGAAGFVRAAYVPVGYVQAGTAPALPAGTRVLGPEPRSVRLHITLVLRSRDAAAMARLAQQVSAPSSPRYRQFLRPRQVQARFGSSPHAVSVLGSWLRRYGLTAGPATGDRLLLPAAGSVAELEKAFRTPIRLVKLPGGRVAYANSRPAIVPASAATWVTGIIGLDNLVLPRPALASTAPAGTAPAGAVAAPGAGRPSAGIPRACHAARTTPATFTADEIARAYGFSAVYHRGFLGSGSTVALFEEADYANYDIATYTRCYRIRPVIRRVRVDGGTTIKASGLAVEEETSDIETVTGLAPRARILVYEAPGNSLATMIDNYAAIMQQDRAQVVSSSYGYCEQVLGAGHLTVILAEAGIFADMAIQGQSVLAASGDAGSEQCLPFLAGLHRRAYQLAVGDPASQPYVTGVGGTAIIRYGFPPTEKAWNQTGPHGDGSGFRAPFDGRNGRPKGYPSNAASDGGISGLWRMPRWQRGFDTSGNGSGIPCGALRGGLCREVPDVSALAAADSLATPGYAIYGTAGVFNGRGWQSIGGTSLASPLWAALLALADQQARGHRLGLVSPALYRIDRADPGAFNDVTAGDNNYLARTGSPSNDTCTYRGTQHLPCYRATRGYDMATGLGSPRAGRLTADLARLPH
jgi:subtilase family serine protease